MDKMIQICDLFGCSMDDLLRGSVAETDFAEIERYEDHMNWFRMIVSLGVGLLIISVSVNNLLEWLKVPVPVMDIVFGIMAVCGVLILVAGGMKHNAFTQKHPYIDFMYDDDTLEKQQQVFITQMIVGVGLILSALIVTMIGDAVVMPANYGTGIFDAAFFAFIAAGVFLLIYGGMGKSQYNIAEYNKENDKEYRAEKEKKDSRIGRWCGAVMLTATIIYLVCGFCFDMFGTAWIVLIVGGMLCGVISILSGR